MVSVLHPEGKTEGNFGHKRVTKETYYGTTKSKLQNHSDNATQKNSLPTEDRGGVINNYDDFYKFMVEKAQTESKEVAAWKLLDNDGKKVYFVLP